jgi:hypothetical protein
MLLIDSFHIVILLGIRKASMPVKLHLNVYHDDYHTRQSDICLCDEGRGGGALVPPGRGEGTDGLVVAGELKMISNALDEIAVRKLTRWIRDSMRMRRNLPSLSLRLVWRCLRTATAFLMSM